MRMTIEQMARAMNAMGEFESVRDLQIGKIRTDSRLVEAGDVFFAIVGRNMDGHTFAVDAAGRGAAAVVVHQIIPGLDTGACPVLLVRDTLQALGCLAARWRRQTRASVVGITGSAGKTTTKEILATILEQIAPTGKNYKNFNNRLGLALSILEFNGLERFWVLELGINETGEMWFGAQLAELDPDEHSLCFFVRSDSFNVFQQARALAWINNFSVSFELLDEHDPIMLGPDGDRIYTQ
ncbi:MAG: hypothetical protein EOM25_07675 [Deltaproteobacteria bacterium]|nr:hypothetical protein [Deltaproteobacteria bacterium]